MSARAASAVLLAAAFAGCERPIVPAASGSQFRSVAPRTAQSASAGPHVSEPRLPLPTFRDVAESAGIAVVNHTGRFETKEWLAAAMGGGAIALDYDQDSDIDLVVVDGTDLTPEGDLVYDDAWRTRLFRNDTEAGGAMKFTDVTAASGIDLKAFGIGGASCDYDADGFPDFFVACWGASHLFHNRGDGSFEDVTAKAGVAGDDRDFSTACAWGDVDGDGVHDLYVATHVDQRGFIEDVRAGARARTVEWHGYQVYGGPCGLAPQKDRLYLGNGDGTFREATGANLVAQTPRCGFQAVMSDLDNDGDLDIFVANDTQPNHLWVNDGKGSFLDRAVPAAVATTRELREQAGMGVDAEDIDRDGWIDLTLTAFTEDQNTIFVNRTRCARVLTFRDESADLGIATVSRFRTAWGVRFLDYDNDGWLDHFSACGHLFGDLPKLEVRETVSNRQRCQILRSVSPRRDGGPSDGEEPSREGGQSTQGPRTARKFDEVTDVAGPAFEIARTWRGAAFGDFDDDGDTDVFVTALNDKAALFRNDCEDAAGAGPPNRPGPRNGFVRFRLVGKHGLRDPSGARVSLKMPNGRIHMSELHHGASFCSDNDPRMLFGLGAVEVVPEVEVRWPSGTIQTFRDVRGRSAYVIHEGEEGLRPDHLASR